MKTQTIYVHDHLNIWETPRVVLHDDALILLIVVAWVLIGQWIFILAGGMKHVPKPVLTLICGPGAWLISFWKRGKMKGTITPPILPQESWRMPHDRN